MTDKSSAALGAASHAHRHAEAGPPKSGATRLLGSLRDALLAAGRETTDHVDLVDEPRAEHARKPQATAAQAIPDAADPSTRTHRNERQHAMAPADSREQAREAHAPKAAQPSPVSPGPAAHTAVKPPVPLTGRVPVDPDLASQQVPRTQPAPRHPPGRASAVAPAGEARTQLLRGRQKVSRATFHQDPVVGWLVVVGGPGLGAHRSIYEGNNTVGRAPTQRITVDFGDEAISGEEQAYIRYDSVDRSFLFVPNMAKTNVVQVNDKKPTGAVTLQAMDVITMGRTQLVFVPFCGQDFDWAELSDVRE